METISHMEEVQLIGLIRRLETGEQDREKLEGQIAELYHQLRLPASFIATTPGGDKLFIEVGYGFGAFVKNGQCIDCPGENKDCAGCTVQSKTWAPTAEEILGGLVGELRNRVAVLEETVTNRNKLARALRSALAATRVVPAKPGEGDENA